MLTPHEERFYIEHHFAYDVPFCRTECVGRCACPVPVGM